MRARLNYARIVPRRDGSVEFYSSYDPGLVAALKSGIPYTDRRFDGELKAWIVAGQHAPLLEALVERHLGVTTARQGALFSALPTIQTRLLTVEYIGMPKEREDGSVSAFGYADGGWTVIFPLAALQNWFEPGAGDHAETRAALTYYALLGVARDADGITVKRAYRNMARRWHPDVSSEPDATEMFQRIGAAYEVLSDPLRRRKYDAGLALEMGAGYSGRQASDPLPAMFFRPPLRCGYILAEGVSNLGRFVVSKITQWEDITNNAGQVMVTSWPAGADKFEVRWT
jgi:hypothetical protein